MEIEIIKDGKETKIKCNNPKGRDTKKGIKLLFKAQAADTELEQLTKLDEYMDFLDQVASEYTGLSIEELDELETDEKNKIIGFYQEKVQGKFDFLKSSLKQEN